MVTVLIDYHPQRACMSFAGANFPTEFNAHVKTLIANHLRGPVGYIVKGGPPTINCPICGNPSKSTFWVKECFGNYPNQFKDSLRCLKCLGIGCCMTLTDRRELVKRMEEHRCRKCGKVIENYDPEFPATYCDACLEAYKQMLRERGDRRG